MYFLQDLNLGVEMIFLASDLSLWMHTIAVYPKLVSVGVDTERRHLIFDKRAHMRMEEVMCSEAAFKSVSDYRIQPRSRDL